MSDSYQTCKLCKYVRYPIFSILKCHGWIDIESTFIQKNYEFNKVKKEDSLCIVDQTEYKKVQICFYYELYENYFHLLSYWIATSRAFLPVISLILNIIRIEILPKQVGTK